MATEHRDSRVVRLAAALYHHAIQDGVLLLLVAVGRFAFLRGLSAGSILLFAVPPVLAFFVLWRVRVTWARVIAHAFLSLIVLGVLIAPFPNILPRLGGFGRALPLQSDRLLSWYAVVYFLFIPGVAPTAFLIAQLQRHRRRQSADVSRSTCVAGLFTCALLWPVLLYFAGALLGLWPLDD